MVEIAAMTADHAEQVLGIYQLGLDSGDASFETKAPTWRRFDADHLAEHRFVAIDGPTHAVVGWVAVTPVSARHVYRGVVEHSVYIHRDARGAGVGRLLLAALIESTERAGIWTIQSSILPENTASLALHQAVGFRIVGVRERIGQRDGRWRDTVLIERRSPAVP